jgi:hypothetical protein
MSRLNALHKQFINEPPVDILIAGFLGYKAPASASAPSAPKKPAGSRERAAELSELASMFPSGVIRG